MTKSITIRDVSDDTPNKLASRAALKGMSLQEYMRAKLDEMANQLDPEEGWQWYAAAKRQ